MSTPAMDSTRAESPHDWVMRPSTAEPSRSLMSCRMLVSLATASVGPVACAAMLASGAAVPITQAQANARGELRMGSTCRSSTPGASTSGNAVQASTVAFGPVRGRQSSQD